MKKYVCDNCKQEIKSVSEGKAVQISIGYNVEDETESLSTGVKRHYCLGCVGFFEDQQWQFIDARRK